MTKNYVIEKIKRLQALPRHASWQVQSLRSSRLHNLKRLLKYGEQD